MNDISICELHLNRMVFFDDDDDHDEDNNAMDSLHEHGNVHQTK